MPGEKKERERMHIPDWLRLIGLVIVVLGLFIADRFRQEKLNADFRVRLARIEIKLDLIWKAVDFGEVSEVVHPGAAPNGPERTSSRPEPEK